MPLTVKEAQAATPREKEYKLSDEKGLFLLIKTNGAKYWRMKYRFQGKEKLLSFGVFPEITLKKAREKRDEARLLLADGIDPSAHKKANKASEKLRATNSFQSIALEWFETQQSDKTLGYQKRVLRALEHDLFPSIGDTPINEVTAPMLLGALRKVEDRGAIETAHRDKQIAGQVFRYAIATGRAERDPTPDLKGALKPAKTKHFSAITTPKEAGQLMAAIDLFQGTEVVRSALKLSALFFCRPGELRHLKWSDINHDELRIELVAEKTHQQHIIPLSEQAISILQDLHPITGKGEYIFPSARGRSRCMSENAIRVALRSMGYDNDTMTPHGFRAMARTLLDEALNYRVEWIEQQLAHAVKDANGRAYNRTKHLEQRTEMMQRWADYLDQLKAQALAGNVITANFRKA
ncbi:tyrosine-type recombinase/integrase [Neptuniibacter pectenicola]|uniref:tyrosine-type recombinase/integrase n=1 Tax=Neptuniibacter pectenicola TaxID=1806669 RepID=UPI0008370252|nr:integrase arm-type DNA-binding domain-containing protein [Neptuniibacter pectenicola]